MGRARVDRRVAGFGIMGGLLMLFGDMCFYMIPVSGADFNPTSVIMDMPLNRLILGGILGPLAGLLYAAGSILFYFIFRAYNALLARILTLLFVVMFILGGAAHSIYPTYGFIPHGDMSHMREKITALIGALNTVSIVSGVAATFLLFFMTIKYKNAYPKWLLLLTPTLWALMNPYITPYAPYPFGSITGGWTNLCFTVYFTVAMFVFGRKRTG